MRFGLNINHLGCVEGAFVSELCQMAESLGFESVWCGEHVVMPTGYRTNYPYSPDGKIGVGRFPLTPDPLVTLTWAAAATKRLNVGTAVLIVPQRNPILLAKELATLDRLSNGRLLLGVGIGWLREEAEALGIDWSTRGRRMDEHLDVLRRLWRDEESSYHGDFVEYERLRLDPRPVRPSGVPIIVGGGSEVAFRRAARWGDGFWPMVEPDQLPEVLDGFRGAAKEAGRDPEEIDITMYAPRDLESARMLADLGVTRLVVWPLGYREDLEGIRGRLERYRQRVMAPLS